MGARTGSRWAWIMTATLILLAGCIGITDRDLDAQETEMDPLPWYTDDVEWDTTGDYSTLVRDTAGYDIILDRLDFEAHDGVTIEMAVWRPDTPDDVKAPIIMDSGPYYSSGIEDLSDREEEFFLDNFVEDGFAYARMAVRGTADSGGCMEFFGENEQRDIDQAVTEVATQEWSNGNVALYGGSYDGTTPWIAASFGNPHVKTIVPVVGLTDVAELMFRNGTSEFRGPIMHSVVYWAGIGMPDALDAGHPQEQICDEVLHGSIAGPYTTLTGDREPINDPNYWEIRNWREPVRENYNGSIFLVHGLQDWNVEATMAYPYVNTLEEEGFEVKHMLGQWGHDWPDRADREDVDVRWDWAEMLHRWFDHHLRENTHVDTGPGAHVQDSNGDWRTEDTWPPKDISWTTFSLGEDTTAEPDDDSAYLVPVGPDATLAAADDFNQAQEQLTFSFGDQDDELRFSGLARLHVQATPHSPEGGQLFAEIRDADEDQRLAHAVMDLRYHAGGTERQELTPGEPVTAKMEFFPADAVIPTGNTLELRITADAPDRVPSHAATPIEIHWGEDASQLILPIIERENIKTTYPGQP